MRVSTSGEGLAYLGERNLFEEVTFGAIGSESHREGCAIKPGALWIMVSGPYATGAPSNADRAENLRSLNTAALELFRRGHVPILGVNLALPMLWCVPSIEAERAYETVMMPLSLALVDRCDACLRIGGPSQGADDEVAAFRAKGKPVYLTLEEVPPAGT
jgi:hypothetical protein